MIIIKNSYSLLAGLCMLSLLAFVPLSLSAADLEDNADLAPYTDGWQNGDNGNLRADTFDPWVITGTGASIQSSLFTLGTNSNAFALTSTGSTTTARRGFTLPAPNPVTMIQFDLLVGDPDVQVELLDGSSNVQSILRPDPLNSNLWTIYDAGTSATTFSFTSSIRVRYLLDNDSTYDIEIIEMLSGSVFTSTGRTTATGANGSDISAIEFSAEKNGSSGDLFFNALNIQNNLIDYRDDASESQYDSLNWPIAPPSTFNNGNSGGLFNFDLWDISIFASFPIDTDANIASAGDIDTNGQSFRLFTNNGATTGVTVSRNFTPVTPNPTTFIQFSAQTPPGFTGGLIKLQDASGTSNAIVVDCTNFGGNWQITDGSGTYVSSYPITDGVLFTAAVTGSNTYDLTLYNITSGATDVQAGRSLGSALDGTDIARYFFEPGIPTGQFFFNSLAVDSTGSIPVPVELSAFDVE
jgi:hypothetical protein